MSTFAAKAFGGMLSENTTLKNLNISGNSFGKMQLGDQVKIKSSGEMKVVTGIYEEEVKFEGSNGHPKACGEGFIKSPEYEWESQFPALCTGVAASQTLTSVGNAF